MELTDEKRTRIAYLLEKQAGEYATLTAALFGAAESARLTSDPVLLDELEAMALRFAVPA